MAAAGADVLLVCGDLLNLIDYGSLQGIMAEVYGPEATRRFAPINPIAIPAPAMRSV